MSAETRAIAARLYHQASDVLRGDTLHVEARELILLIEGLRSETARADAAEQQLRTAAAEDRMHELFGPPIGPYPSL